MSKSKVGRKGKYESNVLPYFEDIRGWASGGATDKEIYQCLGIGKAAFYDYKKRYQEFSDLLKEARRMPVVQIKAALFKRATGFQYEECTEIEEGGVVIKRQRHIKQALPDPACAMILLKHWAKDEGWTNDPAQLELKKKELELKEKAQEGEAW